MPLAGTVAVCDAWPTWLFDVRWLPFADRGGSYISVIAGGAIEPSGAARYSIRQGAKVEFKAPGKDPGIFILATPLSFSRDQPNLEAALAALVGSS